MLLPQVFNMQLLLLSMLNSFGNEAHIMQWLLPSQIIISLVSKSVQEELCFGVIAVLMSTSAVYLVPSSDCRQSCCAFVQE